MNPMADAASSQGLSPRVRGNPCRSPSTVAGRGSIPACAGEPSGRIRVEIVARVYPRVCGVTAMTKPPITPDEGLSPRVRGNPVDDLWRQDCPGSIPACAGEPWPRSATPRRKGVYPRVCGGTGLPRRVDRQGAGLSPRVRGNPTWPRELDCDLGSIPACAGEPKRQPFGMTSERVYPRVCGGTRTMEVLNKRIEGLSPRVRGNRP